MIVFYSDSRLKGSITVTQIHIIHPQIGGVTFNHIELKVTIHIPHYYGPGKVCG